MIVSGVYVAPPLRHRPPKGSEAGVKLYDSKWPVYRKPYWIGDVLEKKPHGWGYFLDRKGNVLYVGLTYMGDREGYGISYTPQTSSERTHGLPPSKRYDGAWHKDMYHGDGATYHDHCVTFQGKFIYNRRHGYGKSFINDRRYSHPQIDQDGVWDRDTFMD